MARRSLRPELNRIRAWSRQGRTDAWIAHQLEVTVQQIQAFKREHGLDNGSDVEGPGASGLDYDDEIDLRAEDDALIAAELEAAEARRAEEEQAERAAREQAERAAREQAEPAARGQAGAEAAVSTDGEQPGARGGRRRRGRRGGRGRGRRKPSRPLEATFDHGEEGYGLWLDPSVQDDPIYAEYWAGHRPVEVTIEEDRIVIRRAGEAEEESQEEE
jgi:hypothetical protein